MATLSEIVSYCDSRTHIKDIEDFDGAENGLQFENKGQVSKIGAAVDAGLIPFQKAAAAGIDFLIVHHGMFWDPAFPVTGPLKKKYATLLQNNIAVYSSHLPLDCHDEIGNNVLLAKALGLSIESKFLEYKGNAMATICTGNISREGIREKLKAEFPTGFTAIEHGSNTPKRIAILSGSGASAVPYLKEHGIDTLITGEVKQNTYNIAEEHGINLYLCGHYATETYGVTALAKEIATKFDLPFEFVPSDCPL